MSAARRNDQGLAGSATAGTVRSPSLAYQPREPKHYRPAIGLIACGAVTKHHLAAYREAGYRVTALCDLQLPRARKRKTEFYPEAKVYRDYHDLLKRDDIEVVDIATYPAERARIIEDSLQAGKHVLSQKPFVLDLDVGRRLIDLAEKQGVTLAVNQNARWAPHFSYIYQAIQAGLLGTVTAAHFSVHWDYNQIKGTELESLDHAILCDFAIHWFDLVNYLLGDRTARRVYASTTQSPAQEVRPPLLAQCVVEFDDTQASLVFDGDTRFGHQDYTFVSGSRGTIISAGPDLMHQTLTLHAAGGQTMPDLEGCWLPGGFRGTMGEMLSAIEEDREPSNGARDNLKSLALCFAAAASADRHQPVVPGTVRTIQQ
jgi:predicted dehydrogenase